ncbi:MAG: RluA family pseudouridine synthase [Flavobacteriales bacterium]|nr:RluA family pseudouridine synthase [Flavobacteriales bacterium]MCW8912082.1 RluA family pseudouridine synthase [Flavobacteriales bacterium]MCW8936722.1 RluA family pseudouridine synthase [Flavobacteriales bacterium]MCW8967127.1 RluA family pseudouridine synthase [Flavobacteriales bacterium]MCW8990504.1 RluA family pseudouridine synthase [Flavobacteriales bacterium]
MESNVDLDILFEDNHLIIVNKRSGEIVQGDKTGDEPMSEKVKRYIKQKYNKPGDVFIGTPHRIDRPTSGIVVFAKTSKALMRLNKMFQDKEIQKTYWAIVKNPPKNKEGKLVHYLKKNEAKNKSFAQESMFQGAKMAELTYKVIFDFDNYFLLEILPKTGRHHQIRVQLSEMGCPIKGDLKYGFNRSNKDASISLHARKISFLHPVRKEQMEVVAPVPSDDPLWVKANEIFG